MRLNPFLLVQGISHTAYRSKTRKNEWLVSQCTELVWDQFQVIEATKLVAEKAECAAPSTSELLLSIASLIKISK